MEHRAHLKKDRKLARIIDSQEPKLLTKKKDVHLQLCKSIMSQQLSTKVAAIIYERFLSQFSTSRPKLQEILDLSNEKLRGIGLSESKARYVKNVCSFFLEKKLTDSRLSKMTSEELIQLLTQIKGVGNWTVEMLLMFAMAKEDVFAPDDFGIQQAMIRLYGLNEESPKDLKKNMLKISQRWSPYRTYACLYLWSWKYLG